MPTFVLRRPMRSVAWVAVALVLSLPLASAQGGNGELRVWVSTEPSTVEVPRDRPVEVPLTIVARASNFTCLQPQRYQATLRVAEPPDVPFWATYRFVPDANVTFDLDGEYRLLRPNAEVHAKEARSIQLEWKAGVAPDDGTFVYRLTVGLPATWDRSCHFNPTLKPQSPGRLGAYLSGGEAPDVAPTVTRIEAPVLEDPPGSAVAAPKAAAGSPALGTWVGLAVLALLGWRGRRPSV